MKNAFPRSMRIARWAVLLLFSMGCISVAEAGSSGTPHARRILVGLYQNPPKIFTDDTGRPSGILVDLLAEIAREENWSLEYVPDEWSNCLQALQDGRIDLMPDVAHSWERAVLFDFHKIPALVSWSQLYANRMAPISGLSDLNGRRIGILEGAIQNATLLRMVTGFGYKVTFVPTGSLEEAFQLASKGRVDAAVANHYFGEYSFRKYGLTKTAVVFDPSSLFYATAKGRNAELLESVDRHLKAWKDNPDSPYYHVLAHWMVKPSPRSLPRYLGWLLAVIAGALILAAGIILLLRAQVKARTRHLEQVNHLLRENIAELERTEEALGNKSALLEAQANSTQDGILVVDEQGKIMFQNRRMVEMWKIPREIADEGNDERQIQHVMHSTRDPERFVAKIEHLYRHPHETSSDEIELVDGTILERYSAPVLGKSGRIYGRIWTFRDITERKRANVRLEKMMSELQRSNKELIEMGRTKDDFLATVSHELRTPLTSIVGYLKILRGSGRDLGEKESLAFLDTALRNGHRLAELVNNLLDLNAKNRAFEKVILETTALEAIIQRAMEVMRNLADQKQIRVELEDAVSGLKVDADAPKLERVFINLISNSLKFTPEKGVITIGARRDRRDGADGVTAWVRNNGESIPATDLERIFTEFYQVDNSTTRKVGGTGLGLSICRRIIEAHGGRIWAESASGEGATFLFFIPNAAKPEVR